MAMPTVRGGAYISHAWEPLQFHVWAVASALVTHTSSRYPEDDFTWHRGIRLILESSS